METSAHHVISCQYV